MIKKVRAPVRIDFGGGTTDIFPFTKKYGGAVLNAAIDRYVVGKLITESNKVSLDYSAKIPTSSGLGTSGAMNVVWLALITKEKNKKTLAENVYKLEQSLGLVGGKQDQYASAFGGINFLEFKNDKVKIEKLKLKKSFLNEFEKKLVLVYTGKPHYSKKTNGSMLDNLKKGKNDKNLLAIKKIAIQMKNSLKNKDLKKFAELMNEETKEREKLHKSIVPKKIKQFIETGFQNGAEGAKVCGSGGGGCVLFLGDEKKLRKKFGKKVIDFNLDFEGLKFI